jgi:hypothetical protein
MKRRTLSALVFTLTLGLGSAAMAGPRPTGGPPSGPLPGGPFGGGSTGDQVCSVSGNNGLFNIGNMSVINVRSDDMLGYLHDHPGQQFGSCVKSQSWECGSGYFDAGQFMGFAPMGTGAGGQALQNQINSGAGNCIIGWYLRTHFTDGTYSDGPMTFESLPLADSNLAAECIQESIDKCSELNHSGL